MKQTHRGFRILTAFLAFLMLFTSFSSYLVTPVEAATSYDVPQVGDIAKIHVSTRLTRSDTGEDNFIM